MTERKKKKVPPLLRDQHRCFLETFGQPVPTSDWQVEQHNDKIASDDGKIAALRMFPGREILCQKRQQRVVNRICTVSTLFKDAVKQLNVP